MEVKTLKVSETIYNTWQNKVSNQGDNQAIEMCGV